MLGKLRKKIINPNNGKILSLLTKLFSIRNEKLLQFLRAITFLFDVPVLL
jgi:hypothetical protein